MPHRRLINVLHRNGDGVVIITQFGEETKMSRKNRAEETRDASGTVPRFRQRHEDTKTKMCLLAEAPGVYEPRKKGSKCYLVEFEVLHKDGDT